MPDQPPFRLYRPIAPGYPRWRRTVIAGKIIADDWVLMLNEHDQAARIHHSPGVAPAGDWQWGTTFDRDGNWLKGSHGAVRSGKEAREAAEAALHPALVPRRDP